jgi:hypothetical protein
MRRHATVGQKRTPGKSACQTVGFGAKLKRLGDIGWMEMSMAALNPSTPGRPILSVRRRARIVNARLRWAVVVMVLLNLVMWGGLIAVAQGLIAFDDHFGLRLISR